MTEQTRKNKIRRLEKHIKKVTRTSVCNDKNALEKLRILKGL